MRGPLDILDVGLLRGSNATVGELGVGDAVLAVSIHVAAAPPVPIHTACELEAGHLLIGEVGDDLDHVATITVDAIHVVLDEGLTPETSLEEH